MKLLHISLFDNDLKTLKAKKLSIKDLSLDDFYLTSTLNLISPIEDKIIPMESNKNIIDSYLIYLSYLYNIDLVNIYYYNYKLFYEIFINLNLPSSIKMSLFDLRKYNEAPYFSDNTYMLDNPFYRETIKEDEKKLRLLM